MHRHQLLRKVPQPHVRHLRVAGMHGLGDNLHQRGVVRQLMQRQVVWLETSWPCVYHDLVGPRLHLVKKISPVKTYRDNALREAARFTADGVPRDAWPTKITYTPGLVRVAGSVLGAMCRETGTDIGQADFRLPIPPEWAARAAALLHQWQPAKPLLIYRPLVQRSWWGGCRSRNPEHAAYATLLRSIRERYFVVSVADLRHGDEWIVGEPIDADVTLHRGELDFETLAALTARAALVYTSPGFAAILGQAVGTPQVVVFGGFEDARSFSAGATYAPYMPIEPITPCACWRHEHNCDKRIDVAAAVERVRAFVMGPDVTTIGSSERPGIEQHTASSK